MKMSAKLLELYQSMVRIRRFEELVAKLVTDGKIHCPCHLYTGQEAIAAGVCAALTDQDWVFSTHRSHGHYLAKGGDMKRLMAELFGKDTGCSRGHGGSMHITDIKKGLPGSSAIVAGTIPMAVGAAIKLKETGNVSVVFFGDGATNEGSFYESLNLASLYKLPVIFICENNLYATHMPIDQCSANVEIYKAAEHFKIPSYRVDGNDVLEVYGKAKVAVDIAKEEGPVFLECMTYRHLGHVGPHNDIDKGLRSQEELDAWMRRDPIHQFAMYLKLTDNTLHKAFIHLVRDVVDEEINDALNFAEESEYPDSQDVHHRVYK
jgi:acetoin:2,6-dichlorophenolindophenol oxidoreductase subunit alpha